MAIRGACVRIGSEWTGLRTWDVGAVHSMLQKRQILLILVVTAVTLAVTVIGVRLKYSRTIVIRGLSVASTQIVSLAFQPSSVRWKIS
jgi:hypothetical protein